MGALDHGRGLILNAMNKAVWFAWQYKAAGSEEKTGKAVLLQAIN